MNRQNVETLCKPGVRVEIVFSNIVMNDIIMSTMNGVYDFSQLVNPLIIKMNFFLSI